MTPLKSAYSVTILQTELKTVTTTPKQSKRCPRFAGGIYLVSVIATIGYFM